MAPKKRRQVNNKENTDDNATNGKLDPISIQSIINQNLEIFEDNYQKEYKHHESQIQEKLALVHREFEKYLQAHESQAKLARSLEQAITRLNHQQTNNATVPQCQELLNKTTDLMNTSALDSSRTKTYLVGELQMLPLGNGN
ncbi:unnamed protein product [Adineta ricciae]|uniref:Uncharacterized protein n=1 Tax=Adineta ricciae TaxID=249248 RepID=A0A813U5H8_ADIRI|nr:unnamed protein product [Adineta ricciae]